MHRVIAVFIVVCSTILPAAGLADETTEHICFRALDADRDGLVTVEEFANFYPDGKARFDAADTNRDGTLTHDEYHDLLGHGAS